MVKEPQIIVNLALCVYQPMESCRFGGCWGGGGGAGIKKI